jgi:hypothetical protein
MRTLRSSNESPVALVPEPVTPMGNLTLHPARTLRRRPTAINGMTPRRVQSGIGYADPPGQVHTVRRIWTMVVLLAYAGWLRTDLI